MIDELPVAPDPAIHSPAEFATVAAAYALAQRKLPGQINAAMGDLSALAAGGAFAIPFGFTGDAAVGGGVGRLSLWNGASQITATQIAFDAADARGAQLKATLDALYFAGATSTIKGYVKLTKVGDVTKWATFQVNGWVYDANNGQPYGYLSVVCVGYSALNPFTVGDSIIMDCQRTGDKGDAGSLTQVLWVCEETSSGNSAGTSASNQRRILNTVKKNTISGASLAGNVITLPAGTYRLTASAPAYNVGSHLAYASIGGGVQGIRGQTAHTGSGMSHSLIPLSEFTIASTSTVEIMHNMAAGVSNGLGITAALGGNETYTAAFIEKVS